MREGPMPTLEERVAYLEGRLGDHFAAVDDLRVTYREFRADANQQFRWIVGVQVTSLIAVGSAVVGLYFK
jgi:hypothetical protein